MGDVGTPIYDQLVEEMWPDQATAAEGDDPAIKPIPPDEG